ncbi:hypothetical protein A2U01_0108293, partial [Trifolium medium]|nr:hypothetical protein [Trifolium medium]
MGGQHKSKEYVNEGNTFRTTLVGKQTNEGLVKCKGGVVDA